MTYSRHTRWQTAVVIGVPLHVALGWVSFESGTRAFENPHPNWFEELHLLWWALALFVPAAVVGASWPKRPFITGCLVYGAGFLLLVGIRLITEPWLRDATIEFFPQFIREFVENAAIGGVLVFLAATLRARWSSNFAYMDSPRKTER